MKGPPDGENDGYHAVMILKPEDTFSMPCR